MRCRRASASPASRLAVGLQRIVGRHFPQPLAGGEVDRPAGCAVAHQHDVVDGQRLQAGQQRHALLLVDLPHLAQGRLRPPESSVDGHPPAHVQQRRAADGRGIAGGVAAEHQPAIGLAGRRRPLRTDQPRQPGHGVGVVVEPGDLPARRRSTRTAAAALSAPPARGGPRPAVPASSQPAAMARSGPARSGSAAVRRVAQPPQRQRAGQRRAVIQMIQAQQERRLVAGLRVEEAPRNLGQLRRDRRRPIASSNIRCAPAAASTRTARVPPAASGRSAAGPRPSGCDGRRTLVGLKEEIVRAIPGSCPGIGSPRCNGPLQPLPGLGQLLQDRPIGGQEEIVDRLFGRCRRIRPPAISRPGATALLGPPGCRPARPPRPSSDAVSRAHAPGYAGSVDPSRASCSARSA